jgi:TetR/AcrR family transcriptional regulator, tetracycline repressor protein
MLRTMKRRGTRARAKNQPAGLTRERVCRAALELVDSEGKEALSMRRLGARLGVEAMSLYRHVRNKDDLLDALQAAILGGLGGALPADGDWRTRLRGLAEGLRDALLEHPNVIPILATRPVRAPEALMPIVSAWMALEREGFSGDDARKAVIAVGVFTIGHVLGEASAEPAPHAGLPSRPGPEEFDFGLSAMLDGIAARRGKRGEMQKKQRGARKVAR